VITVYVHSNGTTSLGEIEPSAISDVLARADELIWLDVVEPSPDELQMIRSEFGFHPLAMEDVARVHQRPKVDMYDDFALIIFYSIARDAATESVLLTQLGIFVGDNYVVTVHDRSIPALEETSDRWNQNVENVGLRTVSLLIYSILDAIVDSYFPILDDISDRLDDLEDITFRSYRPEHQKEIFRLKKELVTIRRVVAPERDVLNVMLRRDLPMFDREVIAYFQDVYDHTIRVTDAVDTYRDLLSNALEFHLTLASNRLNQVMKTLTASSIILMSMTLIASIYGMNFDHMPELHWHLGYPLALGMMLVIGASMGYLFRRIDWL
jgi:magnesium transporter